MSYTYAALKTAIQDYTENTQTSFVASIPSFIRAAEERILKMVQLTLFRRNQTAQMITGTEYLGLPSDYLAPFSLSYTTATGKKVFVDLKDVSFIQEYNPDPSVTGLPKYYASFDLTNFILAPTPNADFVVELHYYYRPSSLTTRADNETTWLSVNAPLCLLYGALIEAYIFMKGDQDLMNMYNTRFNESLGGVKLLGEARESTDEFRTGMIIRPKQ